MTHPLRQQESESHQEPDHPAEQPADPNAPAHLRAEAHTDSDQDHAEQASHASQDDAPHEHAAGTTAHGADTHAPAITKEDFNKLPMLERLEVAKNHYLDLGHLLAHVQDSHYVELPKVLGGKWELPNPLGTTTEKPLIRINDKPFLIGRPTKFMMLELVAALLLCAIFIRFARRTKSEDRPRGMLTNMLEVVVVFIRDEIAIPCIGSKEAHRYLPFLLTLFFFILLLNLIGLLPWFGAATGALAVTGVLAAITFAVVVGTGIRKMGLIGFLKAQAPHMDLPPAMAIPMTLMIWPIEIFGFFIKHLVLALRLFANMFAGHLVLAVLVAFIGVTASTWLFYGVMPIAIVGSVLFCLLEVLVVFLQAYIFTFLAALFIGSAQHAH